MCFMYIVCIPLTRGHVCVCYFTRATVSAEQLFYEQINDDITAEMSNRRRKLKADVCWRCNCIVGTSAGGVSTVHWLRYRDSTSLSPRRRHHHRHQQQQQRYQLSPVTSSCVTSLSGDIGVSYSDTKRPGKKATPVLCITSSRCNNDSLPLT